MTRPSLSLYLCKYRYRIYTYEIPMNSSYNCKHPVRAFFQPSAVCILVECKREAGQIQFQPRSMIRSSRHVNQYLNLHVRIMVIHQFPFSVNLDRHVHWWRQSLKWQQYVGSRTGHWPRWKKKKAWVSRLPYVDSGWLAKVMASFGVATSTPWLLLPVLGKTLLGKWPKNCTNCTGERMKYD